MSPYDAINLLTWQRGWTTLWPVLADPQAMTAIVSGLAEPFRGQVDVVAGPDPGGLLFGPRVAALLEVPFAPVCRDTDFFFQNTDPAVSIEQSGLTLYAHQPLLPPNSRVLVVDDWSESGRTIMGMLALLAKCDASLAGLSLLVDSLPPQVRAAVKETGASINALSVVA